MLKKAGVVALFGFLIVGLSLLCGQKVDAATLPPTLTSPAANTSYGVIPMYYTFGETPLTNTPRLILTGTTTVTITLNIGSPTTGPYNFSINPKDVLGSSGAAVISTTHNVIPNGTYTATLSYQNLAGDPAATVSANNVTISSALVDGDGDGIVDDTEDAAPNGGDANDDNVQDSTQANVVSYVNSVTGNYAVLDSSCDSISGFSLNPESTSQPDVNYSYPFGITSFETVCSIGGATATIRQYYYGVEGNESYLVRKQLPNGTYTTLPDYHLLGAPINGDIVFFVQYDLVDGGPFDDDGVADGTIIDPSGAALYAPTASAATSTSSASLADTGDSASAITAIALLMLTLGTAYLTRWLPVNVANRR